MHYPELATVQARLTYRLTSFLLENLTVGHTVEWMDAFRAQRHTASVLKITERELPWLATRVDPSGHKSFGRRMSGKIVCGDCGRAFGHKTWHSGTPNRVDVWKCPTNYVKLGTCATSHLYQEVFLAESPTQLAFHIPDFLAVLEGGCRLTDGRLGFVFITGEVVTLDLPQRWSPVMRPGELAATGRC